MTAEQAPSVMDPAVTSAAAPQKAGPSVRGGEPKFLFASGARPLDRYTIKRGVGRGGFGEVYFAVSDAGKEVALKLIRRNLDVELRGVTQCLNLKHPNLLALYDVRQDDQDNSWVIMEYVAGESLEEVIRRHPQGMPADEALDWMRGIAAGVGYLHDHGIVHRDLKPGNIFQRRRDHQAGRLWAVEVHLVQPPQRTDREHRHRPLHGARNRQRPLRQRDRHLRPGHHPVRDADRPRAVRRRKRRRSADEASDRRAGHQPAGRAAAQRRRSRAGQRSGRALQHGRRTAGRTHASRGKTSRHGRRPAWDRMRRPASVGSPGWALAGDEEPVWRFVREQVGRAVNYWKNGNLSTPVKILLIVLGVMASPASIKLIILGLLAYAGYRVVRWMVRLRRLFDQFAQPQLGSAAIAGGRQSLAAASVGSGRTGGRAATRLAGCAAAWPPATGCAAAPAARERMADLAGSMLFAAAAVTALAVVMVLLRGQTAQPEQFAWLTLTSTLGAWAVLVPAKLWEGRPGEQALRRFALLVIGLGLGAVAFGIDRLLLVNLPFEVTPQWRNEHVPASFYSVLDGSPLLPAFLIYFGFLFGVLRWWRQADPARSARLSLWTTACTVLAAWVLNLFWPFPQPWGIMVAATMSIAVQLASPWKGPSQPRDPFC